MKGRQEANSPTVRSQTWSWFTDDFFSRFTETAALVMIMTRWHLDDPVGRFLEVYPDARVLEYPALGRFDREGRWVAEESNKKCEALFPELKSKEFLLKRKKVLGNASWMSLYQQNPISAGGDMFPIDKFKMIPRVVRSEVRKSVRYWDKAGTEGGGAYTAGVLMHWMNDDTFVIEDVRHGQWGSLEREKRIKQTADTDAAICNDLEIYVEQEPGSGGKESAENTVRKLAGYIVAADRVTGDKVTRAEPYSAQVQGGNVALVTAEWNQEFLDEHEEFPAGKRKDQVDGSSGAFNKLTGGSTYDTTLNWVG
jgi:predicted phage terminase large subunit-like protein